MKFITTYLSPVKWAFLSACLLSLIHVVSALTVPTLTASIINEGVLQGDLDAISRLSVAMLAASLVTVIGSLSAVYLPQPAAATRAGVAGLLFVGFFKIRHRHLAHACHP